MNDPETNPPGQEVLFLGVKGSGKTVFLSVLGKRFEQEGPPTPRAASRARGTFL